MGKKLYLTLNKKYIFEKVLHRLGIYNQALNFVKYRRYTGKIKKLIYNEKFVSLTVK